MLQLKEDFPKRIDKAQGYLGMEATSPSTYPLVSDGCTQVIISQGNVILAKEGVFST